MTKTSPHIVEKALEVQAWEKWLASPEGRKCTSGEASGEYLKNRLWYAFMAAYAAGKKEGEEETREKVIAELRAELFDIDEERHAIMRPVRVFETLERVARGEDIATGI